MNLHWIYYLNCLILIAARGLLRVKHSNMLSSQLSFLEKNTLVFRFMIQRINFTQDQSLKSDWLRLRELMIKSKQGKNKLRLSTWKRSSNNHIMKLFLFLNKYNLLKEIVKILMEYLWIEKSMI